jgi:hypothetical protein
VGVRPTPRTQPFHNLTFDLATQNSCTMVEPRTVVVPAGKTVSTKQDYVTLDHSLVRSRELDVATLSHCELLLARRRVLLLTTPKRSQQPSHLLVRM